MLPTNLRCEYLQDPIGINEVAPRLSWVDRSNRNGDRQRGYRILVASSSELLKKGIGDLWDSGRVDSAKSVQVEYKGKPLQSSQRAYWTVAVWDDGDRSAQADRSGFWETGLLNRSDWHAQWIGIPWTKGEAKLRPSPFLRHEFDVKSQIVSARAYVTARGLYHFYVDGHRLGNGVLTPDWTDYRKRSLYQTFDVTSMLKPGSHALGLVTGDGWYCGHVGLTGGDNYGTRPLGLVQLDITYRDGTHESVVSDGSWKGTAGPILGSDLLMGETYDARRELGNWSQAHYSDASWKPVDVEPLDNAELQGQYSPLVTQLATLHPKKMTEPKPEHYVFDLGQNMVGWARLHVRGDAGQKVHLRFAEMLNPDGTVYTTNLRGARATEEYVLSGKEDETYEPSFTFHGFRYVEVTGFPTEPDLSTIEAVVVGTNVPKTGTFECSNPMINQIQHNIFWGQRGNYVSIPTDCPQRDERLGWMGDAQIFSPTACFNNDVAGFLTKWTQDVVDAQGPEGGFSDVSPRMGDPSDGAPAWGDAGVIVPWVVYLHYGDERLLAERYAAMQKWVEYINSENADHLWINRRNNNFGDWLNVHDETPKEVLSTAYFAYSTKILAKSARIIGKMEDANKYDQLFEEIKKAFQANYIDPDGKIKGDTQTGYVVALKFDLLPQELRQKAADRLAEHILVDRKGHLSTGFLGTGYLMPLLTAVGRTDIAYKLIETDTYPSWGFEIKQGATTIWERWDGWTEDKGFQDPGMNSFNHYAFGAVGEWMYRTVGGIDLDEQVPGYEQINIKPIPGGGLTWVKSSLQSLHGSIETSWKHEHGMYELTVKVPANTTAKVYVATSDGRVSGTSGAKSVGSESGFAVFEVGGGTYHFRSKL